jgi:hypothetical protein
MLGFASHLGMMDVGVTPSFKDELANAHFPHPEV